MIRSEDKSLVVNLLNLWEEEDKIGVVRINPSIYRGPSIARILRDKLKWSQTLVVVPDYLLLIIELASGGNPGISQVMLKEVLMSARPLHYGARIKSSDFEKVRHIFESEDCDEYFYRKWDEQKFEGGGNKCDTTEWWREVFKTNDQI